MATASSGDRNAASGRSCRRTSVEPAGSFLIQSHESSLIVPATRHAGGLIAQVAGGRRMGCHGMGVAPGRRLNRWMVGAACNMCVSACGVCGAHPLRSPCTRAARSRTRPQCSVPSWPLSPVLWRTRRLGMTWRLQLQLIRRRLAERVNHRRPRVCWGDCGGASRGGVPTTPLAIPLATGASS